MSKITIAIDADKADLIAQYTWAINRLDAIVASNMSTNALLQAAIKDEARILLKLSKLLKKIVNHELG